MAASAGATAASAAVLKQLGLVDAHSYGLLKVAEVKDRFDDPVRLVCLRNPWGDFEWNGDWGDNSDCWTDEIKNQVGWTDEEGLFWMSFKDVCYYFSRV